MDLVQISAPQNWLILRIVRSAINGNASRLKYAYIYNRAPHKV